MWGDSYLLQGSLSRLGWISWVSSYKILILVVLSKQKKKKRPPNEQIYMGVNNVGSNFCCFLASSQHLCMVLLSSILNSKSGNEYWSTPNSDICYRNKTNNSTFARCTFLLGSTILRTSWEVEQVSSFQQLFTRSLNGSPTTKQNMEPLLKLVCKGGASQHKNTKQRFIYFMCNILTHYFIRLIYINVEVYQSWVESSDKID